MEAGRLLLQEIKQCVERAEDFAFETTLSGRSYVRLLKKLRQSGWNVVLFFLWIPSKEFSGMRVQQRVSEGGHSIPVEAIQRRYQRTLLNLMNLFIPLCDEVILFDNTNEEPLTVFHEKEGIRNILKPIHYEKIMESF
jgi:predicted ABC-type ATPase